MLRSDTILDALEALGALTIWWVDRLDLIAFKLAAAVDQLPCPSNKHLDDLRLLQPNSQDLDHAVSWFCEITSPQSAAFSDLDLALQGFGYER